jgi:hypothetical protein
LTRPSFAAVFRLPSLHKANFVVLGVDDICGQPLQLGVLAIFQFNLCHLDGALMMGNHVGHEILIGVSRAENYLGA